MIAAASLVLVLAALQEPSEERPYSPPAPSKSPASSGIDPLLQSIGEFLSHPFRDNGRRFDAYPYAGDGPYFLTSRLSTKVMAVMFEMTYGRMEHDLISFGSEALVSWSSGCDVRVDSLVFQEDVDGDIEETQLHHMHLDIGGYEGPNTIDWSLGIGVGALEDEKSFDYGPSVRAAMRWYPVRPLSLRLDAVGTWFGDETAADLRAEFGIHIHRLAFTAGVRSLLRSDGDNFIGPTAGFAVYF